MHTTGVHRRNPDLETASLIAANSSSKPPPTPAHLDDRVMLLPLLIALTGFSAAELPYSRMPAAQLAPAGLEHHEVLRIARDFGKPDFKVVVDSWVTTADPDRLEEVRFWWVKESKKDERSPFGSKLRKYIGMKFIHNNPDDWTVKLRGDRKEFRFDVEVGEDGRVAAYGDVKTPDGEIVEHCRATDGEFVARRLLGIPIGLKKLAVVCVDAEGVWHKGELPYRKLKRGKLWEED